VVVITWGPSPSSTATGVRLRVRLPISVYSLLKNTACSQLGYPGPGPRPLAPLLVRVAFVAASCCSCCQCRLRPPYFLKVSSYFETVTGTARANLNAHLRFDSEPESDSEASSLASIASARANDRGPGPGHSGGIGGRAAFCLRVTQAGSTSPLLLVSVGVTGQCPVTGRRVPWPRPGPGPLYSLPGAGAAAGATALALHCKVCHRPTAAGVPTQ
jgi:hypothetical protein